LIEEKYSLYICRIAEVVFNKNDNQRKFYMMDESMSHSTKKSSMSFRYGVYQSPAGDIFFIFSKKGLCYAKFGLVTDKEFRQIFLRLMPGAKLIYTSLPKILAGELKKYWAGEPLQFTFPLHIIRGTVFQRKVWHCIKKIPHGKVITYQDIALKIKNPGALRAVGQACGKNPIPIIIPCHRVIGKGGKLGGFSAGLDWKIKLLTLENVFIEKDEYHILV